jgi:DNA anti-recombination protein RmuC
MTKTILKFSRSWGRYNKGEVAGFAPDVAARLIGKVAVIFDPSAPVTAVNAAVQDAAADLASREAALAARERAVAEREAEVAEAEAFLIEPEEADEAEPVKPEPEKPTGAKAKDLPMQGKA